MGQSRCQLATAQEAEEAWKLLGRARCRWVMGLPLWRVDVQARSCRWAEKILYAAGTPPQWTHLWPQLVEWITAVVVARFVCGSVVTPLPPHPPHTHTIPFPLAYRLYTSTQVVPSRALALSSFSIGFRVMV